MALIGRALAALLLASPLATAGAPGSFSHITVEDGLPHTYVRAIVKDRDGFMWFATARGLVRYDGAHLVVYRHDPNDPASLPPGTPSCLLEDRERRLWVGTASSQRAGLGVLDRSTGHFTRYLADGRPGSLSAPNVQAIHQDREGRLWVGHAQGLDLFDPISRTFTAFPIGPASSEPRVTATVEDSRGTFWVATERKGLFQFDPVARAFRSFDVRDRTATGGGDADDWFLTAFLEQPAGTLWVASYGAGLIRIDLVSGRTKRYLPDPRRSDSLSVAQVVRLAGDGDRLVYVGTENGGLDVLDVPSERFTHYRPDLRDPRSLGSASVWALYRDEQGLVWAGVNGFGVSCLSPPAQRLEAIRAGRDGLSDPHVTSIAEGEHGEIWVGTDGGGLHVVDPRTGQVRRYRLPRGEPGSASNAVQSVVADPGGRIWVGFWRTGLCRIDTRDGGVRFYHPPASRSPMSDNIRRVLDAGGGELLVATNDSVFLFDARRESYVPLSERYPGAGVGSVSAAALDPQGGLWLGYPTSVEHVDRRSGAVRRFEGDTRGGDAFVGSFVDALHVDARGHLWVGTERGLSCLDADGHRLAHYGEGDGLPNPNVVSVTDDASGNIWAGTYGGLARLKGAVAGPAGAAVLAFDERDGMTGRMCIRGAAFRSRHGELYFGTSRGLTRFLPEGFQTNTRMPAVVLTGLRLADRPVVAGPGSRLSRPIEETAELVLSHEQADVTFTFAALNYILPQKNRYTHRLEGLDRDWSPVGPETSASYVRIPPGDYVFRVRACNNDGVWNTRRGAPAPARDAAVLADGLVRRDDRAVVGGNRRAAARVTAAACAPTLPGRARRATAAVPRPARHARAGPRRDRVAGRLGAAAPRSPPGGGRALPGDRLAHGRVLPRGDAAHGQPAPLAGPGARRHRTSGAGGRERADVRRDAEGGSRGTRRAAQAVGRRRASSLPHRAGGADQRHEPRAGLEGERLAGVHGRRGGADRVRRRTRHPVREAGPRLPLRSLGDARAREGARDPARGRERAGTGHHGPRALVGRVG